MSGPGRPEHKGYSIVLHAPVASGGWYCAHYAITRSVDGRDREINSVHVEGVFATEKVAYAVALSAAKAYIDDRLSPLGP